MKPIRWFRETFLTPEIVPWEPPARTDFEPWEETHHRAIKSTWTETPEGKKRYTRLLYCPDCLLGWISGYTDERPDKPSITELGVTIANEYNVECAARMHEIIK